MNAPADELSSGGPGFPAARFQHFEKLVIQSKVDDLAHRYIRTGMLGVVRVNVFNLYVLKTEKLMRPTRVRSHCRQ